MKFTIALLQFLLAVLACGHTATASSTFRRKLDQEGGRGGATKRDCELETKGEDKVEFMCKTKVDNENTEIKDKIKFKISHDNKGLKVKVEYEQETEMERRNLEGQIEETETETSFEVVFEKIIEYQKSVGTSGRRLTAEDQAYEWGSDNILNEIQLADWTGFTEVESSRRRLDSHGVEDVVYTFSLSTFDEIATFDFTIAQAGGHNATVTANKMKIDVRLKNYPWMAEDSYLALLSSVESEQEVEVEYVDEDDEENEKIEEDEEEVENEDEDGDGDGGDKNDEDNGNDDEESKKEGDGTETRRRLKHRESEEVRISFGDALSMTGVRPFGEYTWAKTAEVSGANTVTNTTLTNNTEVSVMQYSTEDERRESITIQVVATTPEASTDRLAFSFVGSEAAHGATDIYWDPETGVNYDSSASLPFTALVGYSTFAVAAAVALLGW